MRSKYRRYAEAPDQVIISIDACEAEQVAAALERLMCAVAGKPDPRLLTLDRLILRALLDGKVYQRADVDEHDLIPSKAQALLPNLQERVRRICPFCTATFDESAPLIGHLRNVCEHLPIIGVCACPLCPAVVNVRSFDTHFMQKHNADYIESLTTPTQFTRWLDKL